MHQKEHTVINRCRTENKSAHHQVGWPRTRAAAAACVTSCKPYPDPQLLRKPPPEAEADVPCRVELILAKRVDRDDGKAVLYGQADEAKVLHAKALLSSVVGVKLLPDATRL